MELYKADILRAGEVIDYIDQLRDMPDSAGHFVSTNRAAAEVTYINIENHTAAPVLIKNNRVVTSGKEPGKHGSASSTWAQSYPGTAAFTPSGTTGTGTCLRSRYRSETVRDGKAMPVCLYIYALTYPGAYGIISKRGEQLCAGKASHPQ